MKARKNSIRSMGLEAWLNQRYAPQGGFVKWMELKDQGDVAVANQFGITRQVAGEWRRLFGDGR